MAEINASLTRMRSNPVKPGPGRFMIVKATRPEIAKYIRHPSGADLSNPEGTAWPRDQFSFRRLRDGDIVEVK